VSVCEVPGGRERLRLAMPEAGVVFAIAFSLDVNRIAAGDFTGRVGIWDANTGTVLHETRRDDLSFRLAFSPDGRRLAGVSRARIQVRDVEDGREILVLRAAGFRSRDGGFNPVVTWSPDGAGLLASNWAGTISAWDAPAESLSPERRWEAARAQVFGWRLDEAEAAVSDGDAAAAGFHLDRLNGVEPPDPGSRVRRAELEFRLRRLEEAAKDLTTWVDGGTIGDGWAYLTYARLFLVRDDPAGYRQNLGRLLESAATRLDAGSALELGRIVGLAPCPIEDAQRVLRLIQSFPRDPAAHPSDLIGLAMALHRAQQWEAARATALDYMTRDPNDAWFVYPLMAEVEHRLGQHQDAEQHLAKAREKRDKLRAQTASRGKILDPGFFEHDLLVRQAESALAASGSS
jgi:tetratricopeptide (TPR) repeat protein